jgi:hypothetical protein
MEPTHEQPPSPAALRQGYEPPGVSVKALGVFLVLFLLMAVAVHAGIWFLNKHLLDRPRGADAETSAIPVIRQFPQPDVQPSESHNKMPWEDLADLRQAEAARFEQLGWKADPETGSAVIPDSIVLKLAQRYKAMALPATAPAEAAPTTETTPAPGGKP